MAGKQELDDLSEFEEIEDKPIDERGQNAPRKPDMRVVQPTVDQEGKTIYRSVGGMWKTISKNGNEFYVLRIGELRLLVFPNKD